MIDYEREPKSDIAFVDMKSFYASVECASRGLHPLKTSLCVMSRADNSNGLILASSPLFKEVFGKSNVGRAYDLPFDIHTRKFSYYNAKGKVYRQTLLIFDSLRSGRERQLLFRLVWIYILKKILKSSIFFSNTGVSKISCPTQLMKGSLT